MQGPMRKFKFTMIMTALVVLVSSCTSTGSITPFMADTVFTNGKVLTVDKRSIVAEAFAVKDDKFVFVGSNQQALTYINSQTKVIDLKGRTVIPGLADSHLHTAGGGSGIDLSEARSLSDVFAKIGEAAKTALPGAALVSNNDWHEAQFREQRLPTAAELEAAAPGVPVVLVRGGHSYFLNNTALAKYNITTATPVPTGGAIPVGKDGKLTGEVTDAAKRLVALPVSTTPSLEMQQKRLNAYGITSIRIPGISVADYRAIQQLRAQGQATVRYSILLRSDELATFKAAILPSGIQPGEGDEWVKVWGIKVSADGGFEGGLMTKPYAEPMGKGGTYFGLQKTDQATFNEYMVTLNRAGWRAAVHAVGDAAVDQVLTGFEVANTDNDITHNGWSIEHAFVTRPDQYPRIRKLQLNLSVQDQLYLAAPVLKKYWGMDRASQVTPLKTYLEQGFMVAIGTDSPVVPLSPFWAMYHFMTRDTISDGVYGENQSVTSRDALLRMMTINNATLTDEAAIKGSIEPGKLADFVVLSADYMTIPTTQVRDLKAVATYVGGRQVYQDTTFAQ
ncbi:amidohydrolase [Pseudomonas sp.]|uniref:amidohydrolase n=1 Tax=Pseudomonas sp. TaxID=306 RepID=UPI003C774496